MDYYELNKLSNHRFFRHPMVIALGKELDRARHDYFTRSGARPWRFELYRRDSFRKLEIKKCEKDLLAQVGLYYVEAAHGMQLVLCAFCRYEGEIRGTRPFTIAMNHFAWRQISAA